VSGSSKHLFSVLTLGDDIWIQRFDAAFCILGSRFVMHGLIASRMTSGISVLTLRDASSQCIANDRVQRVDALGCIVNDIWAFVSASLISRLYADQSPNTEFEFVGLADCYTKCYKNASGSNLPGCLV
jgi:hypothetical protein